MKSKISPTRRRTRQTTTSKRKAPLSLYSDNNNNTLYTLVNGVTGQVYGKISLEAFPSLDALFELDDVSDSKFGQALKAGDLSDYVVIRLDPELNSTSLMDKSVLKDTNMALGARSGSAILKNSMNSFILCIRNFRTWCGMTYRPFYLLIKVFVMQLTWFLQPSTTLQESGSYQRTSATSLQTSFVLTTRQESEGRVSLPILRPQFVS